jgi:hypothetical protein
LAEDEKRDARIGGNINVGGSATGSALVSGQHITATVTGPDAAARQQVLGALAAIRAELSPLPGPKGHVASALAATAAEAANNEEPEKEQIGCFLDSALKTASEVAEYAGVGAKLLPYVQTVASWLGGQWSSLIGLLAGV